MIQTVVHSAANTQFHQWEKTGAMTMTTICQTSRVGIVMDSGLVTDITNGIDNLDCIVDNPTYIQMRNRGHIEETKR